MARFASRRKSFRSRKPIARKKLGWVTVAIDDSSRLIVDGSQPVEKQSWWKRIPLCLFSDWQTNEFMSSRATLIRVVAELEMCLIRRPNPNADLADGNATWRMTVPYCCSLICGDIADANGNNAGFNPGGAEPGDAEYFLENDIMKWKAFALYSSGSWSSTLVDGMIADQDTAARGPVHLSISSKVRRPLKNDTAIFLDTAPLVSLDSPDFNQMASGVDTDIDWDARLVGIVRCLVQYT